MEQFEIESEYSTLKQLKDGGIDLTAGTLGTFLISVFFV